MTYCEVEKGWRVCHILTLERLLMTLPGTMTLRGGAKARLLKYSNEFDRVTQNTNLENFDQSQPTLLRVSFSVLPQVFLPRSSMHCLVAATINSLFMTFQRLKGPINNDSHLYNLIFANILTWENQLIRTRAVRMREKSAEVYLCNPAWSCILSYIKGAYISEICTS